MEFFHLCLTVIPFLKGVEEINSVEMLSSADPIHKIL